MSCLCGTNLQIPIWACQEPHEEGDSAGIGKGRQVLRGVPDQVDQFLRPKGLHAHKEEQVCSPSGVCRDQVMPSIGGW